MQDLIAIDSRNSKGRLVLAGAIIFAVLFLWFSIRWQLGSMIARLTSPGSPEASQAADLAGGLAPNDPVAKLLQASIDLNTGNAAASLSLLEEAVRLSPNDYRWRVELARALEQEEKIEPAEREFKRAVELAPTYAFPQWHLGNFYLRQNRAAEAFAALRAAAANNAAYREQVFSLAWDYFDKDPEKVEQLAADDAASRASLALFFAARGRATDALRVWNLLSETDKEANPQTARSIAHGLFTQRFFPPALEFARQLGIDADARPEAVTNPGFERLINSQDDSRFGWQINRVEAKIDISADGSVKHSGARSLKIAFRSFAKPELYTIFQTVAVEPNKNYRLSFWVRTENLRSSGGPLLEIVNANDDKPVAASKEFRTGTNDWEQYVVDLRTPEDCSGVTIRTARAFCGEQCPIAGIFWYDDFELSKQ
jgi:tetratricopeptide (TPR) repeat protein